MLIEYFPETLYESPFNFSSLSISSVWTYIDGKRNKEIDRCWLSFSIPTHQLIADIQQFIGTDTCLEIGAGRGLWAYLIGEKSHIIATDLFVKNKTYTNVVQLDGVCAVHKYATTNCLLIVWPLCDDTAARVLKDFRGTKMIYVGESKGGCTGSDDFFNQIHARWKLIKSSKLMSDFSSDDNAYFFVKIENQSSS